MKRIKIVIDVRLLSKGGASGVEEYTVGLIDKIVETDRRHDYELFYNGLRKVRLTHFEEKGIPIINWHIPNKIFDASTKFLNFPQIDKYLEADLIFTPHLNILSVSPKTPRVMTFHDLSFIHHPDFYPMRKRFWHWQQDIRKQVQKTERIIAVSNFTKNDLEGSFGLPPEKVVRIYSGISPIFKEITPVDALMEFAKDKQINRPFILFLGTIEPRKNVTAAIRAFNLIKKDPKLKDYELFIVGSYGWLYRETLREIDRSPYRQDIRVIGRIKNEERPLYYNLASVFLYPSFFEGFGFPPLEAQACGTPVVASNRTSLPEILKKSALLCDPWKVDELAEKTKEVLLNDSLHSKLRRAGLRNARNYTWSKSAKETLKVFNTLL